MPVEVKQVQDVGTYWLVTASCGGAPLRARLAPGGVPPRVGERVWLKVIGSHTCYYGTTDELLTPAAVAGVPA